MTISCDDGCASDLRLFGLARKYSIPVTFYWPVEWHSLAYDKGYEPLRFTDAWLISKNADIGSHTITHRHLTDLPLAQARYEIDASKTILQKMFGKKITKFCPPRGYTNDHLTQYTLRRYDSQRLTKGKGLVHIHPDSGANDNKPWREAITPETKEIWCHSWELDKYNLWEELEEFLKNERY